MNAESKVNSKDVFSTLGVDSAKRMSIIISVIGESPMEGHS